MAPVALPVGDRGAVTDLILISGARRTGCARLAVAKEAAAAGASEAARGVGAARAGVTCGWAQALVDVRTSARTQGISGGTPGAIRVVGTVTTVAAGVAVAAGALTCGRAGGGLVLTGAARLAGRAALAVPKEARGACANKPALGIGAVCIGMAGAGGLALVDVYARALAERVASRASGALGGRWAAACGAAGVVVRALTVGG